MIFVRGKLQSNPVVLCYFSAELQLWDRINFELPSPPVSCPPYPSSSSDNDAEMATPSSLQKNSISKKNSITQHNTAASSNSSPNSQKHKPLTVACFQKNDRTSYSKFFSLPLSRNEERKTRWQVKRREKPNLLSDDDDGEIRIEIQIRKRERKKRRFFVFFLHGRIRSYLTSTSSFFVHQLMMMGSSGPIMEGIVVIGLHIYP